MSYPAAAISPARSAEISRGAVDAPRATPDTARAAAASPRTAAAIPRAAAAIPRAPTVPVLVASLLCGTLFGATRAGAQPAAPARIATPSAAAPPNVGHAPPTPASKAPNATAAFVAQPRATGYFVGDTFTQRVLLEKNGQALSPATLPKAGRVSAWFERRTASIQTDSSSRRWLVIEYQILNAPPKLVTVKLPGWSVAIRGASGVTPAALLVPEARVSIAPLSLPGSPTQVGTSDLRPDHLPPFIETAPILRAIETSAVALILTLIAWLAWFIWRNGRALATQPFATALREMRALDEREPRAWQALHRAFDRTAGRVIQSTTLPVLFERAPQLIPARGEIEQFFAQSSRLFFGGAQPAPVSRSDPASESTRSGSSGPSPRALCLELRRIEKRYER